LLYGLKRRADIYHFFFAPNPLASWAASAQIRVSGVRAVQTVCSRPREFSSARLFFGDRIIALSRATREAIVETGIERERVRLVRPFIEPLDPLTAEARARVRREYELPEGGSVVLYPGDLEFTSAARTVVAALDRLSDSEVVVAMACRFKTPDALKARDELVRIVSDAGHERRVVFLERVRDMPSLVGAADVVLLPAESLYAKMDAPLVLLEAMARGVPLVLGNVPPLSELLELGVGLGVSPGCPGELADAVGALLADPGACRRYGLRGREAVEDVFSPERGVAEIEAIYDEVLER